MEDSFQDIPIGAELECAFISLDLEGHTRLLRLVPDKRDVEAMRDAFRDLVYVHMQREDLRRINWAGDGGRFAAYGDASYAVRAVRACLSILSEWYSFTEDANRNRTRRGLTLRIGADAGPLVWMGDITNIRSDAINQAVKLEQELRPFRAGAVKFAITSALFNALPADLQVRFRVDAGLSRSMAGATTYWCSTPVAYPLPTSLPHFSRHVISGPAVAGRPIREEIIVDNTDSDADIVVEWAVIQQDEDDHTRWSPVEAAVHAREKRTAAVLPHEFPSPGEYVLPRVRLRYRLPESPNWLAAAVDRAPIVVEAPKPPHLDVKLSSDPPQPVSRIDFSLTIELQNGSNVDASAQGTIEWAFASTPNVRQPTISGHRAFSHQLGGYQRVEVPLVLRAELPADFSAKVTMAPLAVRGVGAFAGTMEVFHRSVEFNWNVPCVGRDRILESLTRLVRLAFGGQGCILIVEGPAGSGKSTLVDAAVERLRRDRCAVLDYRFVNNKASPNAWASSVLRTFITDDRPAPLKDVNPERLRARHRVTFDALIGDSQGDALAALGASAREAQPGDWAGVLNDAAGRFGEVVAEVAELCPLLFVIDDLHNADSSTLELLKLASSTVKHSRIAVLTTLRSEESHRAEMRQLVQSVLNSGAGDVVRCTSIDVPGIEDWLRNLFDGSTLRAGFPSKLRDATDGRPLYVKNCLVQLYRHGEIQRDEARLWFIDIERDLQLTFGVGFDEVLRNTFLQLPPPAQRCAQRAAVIGMVVPYKLLRGISSDDQTAVDASISTLIDSQVLKIASERLPGTSTAQFSDVDEYYTFDHGRLQEIIYDTILGARRRELHRSIAEFLETHYQADLPSLSADLANHWHEAGEHARALPYLIVEANKQFNGGNLAEAMTLYRRVVRAIQGAVDPTSRLIHVLVALRMEIIYRRQGNTTAMTASLAEAVEALKTLKATAGAEEQPDVIRAATPFLNQIARLRGQIPPIDELRAELALEEGRQEQWAGHLTEAAALYSTAASIADSVGDTETLRHALRAQGLLAIDRGDARTAVGVLESALASCSESTLVEERAEVLQHLGRALFQRGQWMRCRDAFDEAIALGQSKRLLASAHNYLGEALRLQGKWRAALSEFSMSRSLAEAVGATFTASFTVSNRAKLAYHMGLYDDAIRLAGQYIAFCKQQKGGYRYGQGIATMWMGLAQFRHGDEAVGIATLTGSLSLLSGGLLYGESLAHLALAETYAEASHLGVASIHTQAARDGFEAVGDDYHATKARLVQTEIEIAGAEDLRGSTSNPRISAFQTRLEEIATACEAEYFDLLARCLVDQFRLEQADGMGSARLLEVARRSLTAAVTYNANTFQDTHRALRQIVDTERDGVSTIEEIADEIYRTAGYPQVDAIMSEDLH